MWYRWFPWKYLIRRTARKHGFLDPITLITRLRQFAQPAEVSEPVELIRAGALFHARGLINTRAIQHNLDWVWPYWVEQQFNPHTSSFIPRAFSITHVNLTHRDWTAVGLPNCDAYPIIDPRGLVTPMWDGWSLDAWVLTNEGEKLIPSRTDAKYVKQNRNLDENRLLVTTRINKDNYRLHSKVWMEINGDKPVCRINYRAAAPTRATLVISLRPCNPEGISFIHSIKLDRERRHWRIGGKNCIELSEPPSAHFASRYRDGDVYTRISANAETDKTNCNVGLATAAACYAIKPGTPRTVEASVDLSADSQTTSLRKCPPIVGWREAINGAARLSVPDPDIQGLYDNAVRTLVLMTPDWAYPGPYTYKRFWYRDAALMINGLLCAGMTDRAHRVIDKFPDKQTITGFFHSQEGEWDANGEVLWAIARYCRFTNQTPDRHWLKAIRLGGDWILEQLLTDAKGTLHRGLLPAGDNRFYDIVKTVGDLASPTGNWPEAIHPLTGGGCMGDGQHAWAAAEWIIMLRNMFVMEEEDRLIIGAGIPEEWVIGATEPLSFGPATTAYGKITVTISCHDGLPSVDWDADWYGEEPTIEVKI